MSKFFFVISCALTFLTVPGLRADVPATAVRLQSVGTDAEGRQTFLLEWDAVTNTTYLVQSGTFGDASGLGSNEIVWTTIDTVEPTNTLGSYRIVIPVVPAGAGGVGPPAAFYRLSLPRTVISSVEPAAFAPGVPVTLYLIGQCFQSNDVVRVDGQIVALGSVTYVGTWDIRIALPPQTPGPHLIELVRGGQVVATFTVTCADPVANPELVLQGPPGRPLASPLRVLPAPTPRTRVRTWVSVVEKSMPGGDHEPVPVRPLRPSLMAARAGGDRDDDGDGQIDYPMDVGVALHSGEVSRQVVDLAVRGRSLDFIWARTYHSRLGRIGASTNGWTFSYDVSLTEQPDGSLLLRPGNGRADTFHTNGTGGWSRDEYFSEIQNLDTDGNGGLDRLVFFFSENSEWRFHPFDPLNPSSGKLMEIVDRNQNTMTLNYDGSGRLVAVVDDLGRTNSVGYDTAGRVASVTDFSGRTVTYQYYQGLPGEPGGAGDLQSVTSPPVTGTSTGNDFPAGKTTTYTYSKGFPDDRENHLLLSVIDAAGKITHKHVYQHNQTDLEFLRCISVQRGTNTPALISYLPQSPAPANQFAALRCVVNDPLGNVSEHFLDARGRVLRELQFTGRATPGVPVTDTVNRPTGPLRVDDPPWFETRYEWNNDSLCTRVVLPRGDRVEYVYESDFDASTRPRKRADLRILREHAAPALVVDADGDGEPDPADPDSDGDGIADLTKRTWRYEYDPRFGSEAAGRVGRMIDIARARNGDPWASKVAKTTCGNGIKDIQVGEVCDDFSVGDGKVNHLAGEDCDPGMNLIGNGLRDVGEMCDDGNMDSGDGFVISRTNPRGTVTTARYDANGNCTSVERRSYSATHFAIDVAGEASYSAHGQLTALTNAADANGFRRVDTFSYYTSGPQAGYLQSVTIDDRDFIGLREYSAFEYDARGNITRYINPNTNDWLFTYNTLDQLVQRQSPQLSGATAAIPPWRITTQFTYDSRNNLTHIRHEDRDQNGTLATNPWWTTQFIYDDLSRAVGCWRDKDKVVLRCTSVSYDANDNVTLFRSGEAVNGNDPSAVVSYEYDERNFLFRRIAAPGTTISLTSQCDYDANGNVIRLSEGLEGTPSVTTIEHVSLGVGMTAVGATFTPPALSIKSEVVLMDIKENFDELKVPDRVPLLPVRIPLATQAVRPAKITDPLGNVTAFSYDANDNVKIIRHFGRPNDVPGTNGDIRLAERRCEYDGFDRRITTRAAFFDPATQAPIGDGQSVTSFSYAPNGQCVAVTDPLGRITAFGYDTAGRPASMSRAGGKSVVAVLRDRAGNVTSMTQTDLSDLGGLPQVFSITNVFDKLNRCLGYIDNVGNHHRWDLDSRGLMVRAVDAAGNVSTHAYDGLGRPTLAIADLNRDGLLDVAVDSVRRWVWDDNDRLVAETDSNTNSTTRTYDSRNRLVTTTEADGTVESLVWSPRNNLASRTDANGTVMIYTHDLNDRLISKAITPGPGVAATTTFEQFAYDGAGRLIMASNDVSRVEFDYDSMGNNVRSTQDGWSLLRAFDKNNDCISITHPSGLVVSNTYEALGRISSIAAAPSSSVPAATLTTYDYDGGGRLAQISRSNGVNTRIFYGGVQGVANAPDDFGWGQVSEINHAHASGTPVIDQRRTAHDRNQNRTLRAQLVSFSTSVPPRTNSFGHDGLNRMTGNTDSALNLIRFYDLDAEGNRRFVTNGTTVQTYTRDATLPHPGDFQMNQFTTTPFGSREYDANGNLHATVGSDGIRAYEFDYANRLVGVQRFDGSAFVPVVSYRYDALGQRISKTVPGADSTSPPVTTEFWYDRDFSGDGVPDLIATRQSGAWLDSFIHKIDDGLIVARVSAGGAVAHYHCDDLGNTLALTDGAGLVLERTDYGDFGQPQFLDLNGLPLVDINGSPLTSSPSGNPFLFRGWEWDGETGMHHLRDNNGVEIRFEQNYGKELGLVVGENPLFKGGGFHTNPLYEGDSSRSGSGGRYFDPQIASAIRGKVKIIKVEITPTTFTLNPWSNPRCFGAGQPRPQSCDAQSSRVPDKYYRSSIPAGFVTKKTFGQLAGKK